MTKPETTDKLQRVCEKLNQLLSEPADFVMTRWIFDWDDKLPPIKNIESAHQEMEALLKLKNLGCLKLKVKENPVNQLGESATRRADIGEWTISDSTPSPGYRKYRSSSDYSISAILFYDPKSDKAWSGYDWAVWLTGFDNDRFEQVSKQRTPEDAGIEVSIRKMAQGRYLSTPTTRHLIHTFTRESSLEDMFNQLYTRSGSEISASELSLHTQGYAQARNVPEDLRGIGFNKLLKKYFFPICSKKSVMFVDKAVVRKHELEQLLTELKPD